MATLETTKGRNISRNQNRWISVTADHEVGFSESLVVDATSPVTVTLPASPITGGWVEIYLAVGDLVTINGNGTNIVSQYAPAGGGTFAFRQRQSLLKLVYDGTQWNALSTADYLGQKYTDQTSDFTASAGQSYNVDVTSNPVTVTLPSSPSVTDIFLYHIAGDIAVNPITITASGVDTIFDVDQDIVWNEFPFSLVRFHYTGSTWIMGII